ncbi:cation:proton antiporter [Candidatus Woesearchaeota archaeon]|nr:cation:proton antiporter [Candidatus Woesearchaeota archaeon]
MLVVENTLFVLAVILFFGLVIPEFFKRFHIPLISSVIILGSILGPNGVRYFSSTEPIELFGLLGASFLMLMAGLEIKTVHFRQFEHKILLIAFINSVFPFVTGAVLMTLFGFGWQTSLMVGILFVSTSFTIIISVANIIKKERNKVAQILLGVVIIEDMISLFLFSVLMEGISPHTIFPLPIYIGVLISSIIILKMFLPEVIAYLFQRFSKSGDRQEDQLRIVLSLLLFTIIFYAGLGVHPIVASFLVGLVLADHIHSGRLQDKLHTVGYGLFVPVFFFLVGAEINLGVIRELGNFNLMLISVFFGVFVSKLLSGFFAAKAAGFSNKDSLYVGVGTTPKLTTAVSTAFALVSSNLLHNSVFTAVVMYVVVSTLIGPYLIETIWQRVDEKW